LEIPWIKQIVFQAGEGIEV